MRDLDQGYLIFVALLFGIFKAWKWDSSSLLRPSAQGYVTTGGPYFDALKMPLSLVVRSWSQGYLFSSENVYTILANRKFDYSSVMRPTPYRYLASTWPHPQDLLVTWKWDSSKVMRLLVVECMDCVEQLFVSLAAWKSDSCSRATGIKVNHWSHFGNMKMWFLKRYYTEIIKGNSLSSSCYWILWRPQNAIP